MAPVPPPPKWRPPPLGPSTLPLQGPEQLEVKSLDVGPLEVGSLEVQSVNQYPKAEEFNFLHMKGSISSSEEIPILSAKWSISPS